MAIIDVIQEVLDAKKIVKDVTSFANSWIRTSGNNFLRASIVEQEDGKFGIQVAQGLMPYAGSENVLRE